MMRKTARKLHLAKETLRSLAHHELAHAAGNGLVGQLIPSGAPCPIVVSAVAFCTLQGSGATICNECQSVPGH